MFNYFILLFLFGTLFFRLKSLGKGINRICNIIIICCILFLILQLLGYLGVVAFKQLLIHLF